MRLKRQSEGMFIKTFDINTTKRGQFISEKSKENKLKNPAEARIDD